MATADTADVVVVGSGVCGAMIAHEAVQAGLSVLVLEAGPRGERGDYYQQFMTLPASNRARGDFQSPFPQSPYAPFPMFGNDDYLMLKGPDAAAFRQGYLRVVGGTTWHWSGLCWRHLPVDLRLKSTYGVGRDWPISYDEIEPYYAKAESEMGVSGPMDPAMQSPSQRSAPYVMEPATRPAVARSCPRSRNPPRTRPRSFAHFARPSAATTPTMSCASCRSGSPMRTSTLSRSTTRAADQNELTN